MRRDPPLLTRRLHEGRRILSAYALHCGYVQVYRTARVRIELAEDRPGQYQVSIFDQDAIENALLLAQAAQMFDLPARPPTERVLLAQEAFPTVRQARAWAESQHALARLQERQEAASPTPLTTTTENPHAQP